MRSARAFGCCRIYLDGIIEAAHMTNKRFVWAVQWHPEYMFKTDADSLAIFSWFIEHCI